MNLYTMFMVYALIWWIVLFMLLPVGVKVEHVPENGHASSAPVQSHIGKKLIWTTLLSFPIFFLVKWAIDNNIMGI